MKEAPLLLVSAIPSRSKGKMPATLCLSGPSSCRSKNQARKASASFLSCTPHCRRRSTTHSLWNNLEVRWSDGLVGCWTLQRACLCAPTPSSQCSEGNSLIASPCEGCQWPVGRQGSEIVCTSSSSTAAPVELPEKRNMSAFQMQCAYLKP